MLKSKILKGNIMEITGDMGTDKEILSLLNTIKKHVKNEYKILIVIDEPIKEFQQRVGLSCADKVGFDHMLTEDMLKDKDELVYEFIGKMILDNYIPDDYYIQSNTEKIIYTIKGVKE